MLSSSTPYDIEKTDTGEIVINLDSEQYRNHAVFEGYDRTFSVTVTTTTRNEIIQQVVEDLKSGTPFVRFKREVSRLTTATFTTQFVVFLLLWSIIQLVIVPFGFGIPLTSDRWLSFFVLSSENIGYVWTWVTSIFSHGGFLHLFVNSIVIISFGYFIEEEIGKWKYMSLFLISALLAGVFQVAVVSFFSSETIRILGASGGAAALIGCAAVFYPKMRIALFFIVPMELWKAVVVFVIGSVGVVSLYGFGAWNIAHTAHIFGLLCGVGYGFYHQKYVRGVDDTMFRPSDYTD